MTALVDAALAIALASEAEHRIEVQPVVDVRKHLHTKQLEAMACDAPALEVLGGRQGGKTFFDVGWSIEGALEVEGSTNPYFGLTSSSVGDIWWPEVQAWWAMLGWDQSDLHEHTKTAKLPNGSILKGRGTDDRRTIETSRGAKYNRIVVDEMGAQDERFIRYFVNLLWPTMIKNRGRMLRSGNPGLVLSGYWYEHTNEHREVSSPLFHWTAWDNPALGSHADVDEFVSRQTMDDCGLSLEEIKERIADGAKEGPAITFQREWLAKWIQDVGALVFPFLPHRNAVVALPTRNPLGVPISEGEWRHFLAADVGYVDSCAFAHMAYHPMLPDDYILRVTKHPNWISPQFVDHMRRLKRDVNPYRLPRVDTGGMGKPYAEHCIRAGVAVLPAEKTEKKANVRLFRDRIIAGRVKYVEGECDPLLDECAVLGWADERKELPEDGKSDDATFATIYDWRDMWNMRDGHVEPVDNSPEAIAQRQEDAWIAQRMGGAQRSYQRTQQLRAAAQRR